MSLFTSLHTFLFPFLFPSIFGRLNIQRPVSFLMLFSYARLLHTSSFTVIFDFFQFPSLGYFPQNPEHLQHDMLLMSVIHRPAFVEHVLMSHLIISTSPITHYNTAVCLLSIYPFLFCFTSDELIAGRFRSSTRRCPSPRRGLPAFQALSSLSLLLDSSGSADSVIEFFPCCHFLVPLVPEFISRLYVPI